MRMRLEPTERYAIRDAMHVAPTGRPGEFITNASSPLANLHNGVLAVQGRMMDAIHC